MSFLSAGAIQRLGWTRNAHIRPEAHESVRSLLKEHLKLVLTIAAKDSAIITRGAVLVALSKTGHPYEPTGNEQSFKRCPVPYNGASTTVEKSINYYKNLYDCFLSSRIGFKNIVYECLPGHVRHVNSDALISLQMSAEDYASLIIKEASMVAKNAKRKFVTKRDMDIVYYIHRNLLNGFIGIN